MDFFDYICSINLKHQIMAKKSAKESGKRRWLLWSGVVLVLLIGAAAIALNYGMSRHEGDDVWVYIPKDATKSSVRDSLISALGEDEGELMYKFWQFQNGTVEEAHGAYKIANGDMLSKSARRMVYGMQTPVKVVWSNVRTFEGLAQKITSVLECTAEEFIAECDNVLAENGFKPEEYSAAFLPDSYEFYWSVDATSLINKLLDYRNRFWNSGGRISKAEALGLTKVQVATLASIVEEETSKRDEMPLVARLYLNRLQKEMKLQADPTVKFAAKDPSIRRITKAHLKIESPYNTYLHYGLPPGPIRNVDSRTLDAVLNAPEHNYIFMCAKEDFSGYHNFAEDYDAHMANARRYQAELNRRGIR